jgi:hypothetical protein
MMLPARVPQHYVGGQSRVDWVEVRACGLQVVLTSVLLLLPNI